MQKFHSNDKDDSDANLNHPRSKQIYALIENVCEAIAVLN